MIHIEIEMGFTMVLFLSFIVYAQISLPMKQLNSQRSNYTDRRTISYSELKTSLQISRGFQGMQYIFQWFNYIRQD